MYGIYIRFSAKLLPSVARTWWFSMGEIDFTQLYGDFKRDDKDLSSDTWPVDVIGYHMVPVKLFFSEGMNEPIDCGDAISLCHYLTYITDSLRLPIIRILSLLAVVGGKHMSRPVPLGCWLNPYTTYQKQALTWINVSEVGPLGPHSTPEATQVVFYWFLYMIEMMVF